MKKLWITLGIIIIVFAIIFIYTQTNKEPDVIKIGAILPLTGDGAKYGEEAKNGIDLAIEELNDKKIRIIYEDDYGSPSGAVSAFNKLITKEKIQLVIGAMYSSSALSLAPLGEKNKVVILSISASSPELTYAGDYFFRIWPSDIYEGKEMAKFTFNKLGIKELSILSVNLDYGIGLAKVFNEEFNKLGGKVIITETYEKGSTDFRTQLIKIKNTSSKGLYLPGYYSDIGLILRQARELKIKLKFLSCVGFDNPKVLEIAGNSADGVIFSRPYFDTESNNDIIKPFVEKYIIKYKTQPGIYSAHAYDAIKIMAKVLKENQYDVTRIKDILYTIKDYPGVTGPTSFDNNGDVIKPIQIMEVKNGKFTPYK